MDLLFPLLIIFFIGMIFFSNRQRKKQQEQTEAMQNSVEVGDVVLMTSGISGTVVDTDDERTIDVEIAPDIITTWLRAAVREKLSSDADSEHADGAEDENEPADAVTATDASADHTDRSTAGANGSGAAGNGVTAGSSAPGETRSS